LKESSPAVQDAAISESEIVNPKSKIVNLKLDACADIVLLIAQAIVDDPPAIIAKGGFIRPGFSAELDGIIASSREAKVWVANLEQSVWLLYRNIPRQS
jgi:DNA mismatch repair protein MutS